jgi:hypothetical protein
MAQPSQSQTTTTTATDKSVFVAHSHFERAASSYEDASAATKDVARHLLTLSPPLTSSVIQDVASGRIVTGEILKLPQFVNGDPAQAPAIHATDYSAAMLRALES